MQNFYELFEGDTRMESEFERLCRNNDPQLRLLQQMYNAADLAGQYDVKKFIDNQIIAIVTAKLKRHSALLEKGMIFDSVLSSIVSDARFSDNELIGTTAVEVRTPNGIFTISVTNNVHSKAEREEITNQRREERGMPSKSKKTKKNQTSYAVACDTETTDTW